VVGAVIVVIVMLVIGPMVLFFVGAAWSGLLGLLLADATEDTPSMEPSATT
jgi:hypothetical protein